MVKKRVASALRVTLWRAAVGVHIPLTDCTVDHLGKAVIREQSTLPHTQTHSSNLTHFPSSSRITLPRYCWNFCTTERSAVNALWIFFLLDVWTLVLKV